MQQKTLNISPFPPVQGASQVALVVKNSPASAGNIRGSFDPRVGKIPCRRAWKLTPAPAWRIPWTEEPGRLRSAGLQRLGHDGSVLARMHPAPEGTHPPLPQAGGQQPLCKESEQRCADWAEVNGCLQSVPCLILVLRTQS